MPILSTVTGSFTAGRRANAFSQGGGGASDPNFANVSALFKTPNIGSISDVTGNLGNVFTVGSASVNADQTKFQPASMKFTGGKLTFPYSNQSALDFGTGSYTVEAWIYRTATGTVGTDTTYQNILSTASSGQGGWGLILNNSDGRLAWKTGSSGVLIPTLLGDNYVAVPLNTWTHVAVARENTSGGGFGFFVNGFRRNFTNASTDDTSSDGSDDFVIGGDNDDSYTRFTGYIEDVRITKGVARYTADFTPPTAEFPTS